MKHFAKLMLLTLGSVLVVAVIVSFLPRHTAAAPPTPPPPPNLTLLSGTAQCAGSFVAILPTGVVSPSTGCYTVPEGKYLVVTDVIVSDSCASTGPADVSVSLTVSGGPNMYYAIRPIDGVSQAYWHDSYVTGLVFASVPVPFLSELGSALCVQPVITLQGYLVAA